MIHCFWEETAQFGPNSRDNANSSFDAASILKATPQARFRFFEDVCPMLHRHAEASHSQPTQAHEERQDAGKVIKLLLTLAILPEIVSDVGLSQFAVSSVDGKIMLQLGSYQSQIVRIMNMLFGALKIDDINPIVIEEIVHGIGIAVHSATEG